MELENRVGPTNRKQTNSEINLKLQIVVNAEKKRNNKVAWEKDKGIGI